MLVKSYVSRLVRPSLSLSLSLSLSQPLSQSLCVMWVRISARVYSLWQHVYWYWNKVGLCMAACWSRCLHTFGIRTPLVFYSAQLLITISQPNIQQYNGMFHPQQHRQTKPNTHIGVAWRQSTSGCWCWASRGRRSEAGPAVHRISRHLSISLSLYIYIYIYNYTNVCIHT